MITTTLKDIRANRPCEEGWIKLLSALGKTKADDEPFPLETVLDSNGIEDAIWCMRALPEVHDLAVRLLICNYAESVLHIFETHYPTDDRPRKAIETARRFAHGHLVSQEELAAAEAAARAATGAAAGTAARDEAGTAARDEAGAAAWAAAWAATGAAAWDGAGAAAEAAAWAAAWAAARAAAGAAAWDAARAAARKKQADEFRRFCRGEGEVA